MVQRYGTSCAARDDGCFVKFEDYAALEAEVRALREFHAFFRSRCEGLFAQFGMGAVDLYNAAAIVARKEETC